MLQIQFILLVRWILLLSSIAEGQVTFEVDEVCPTLFPIKEDYIDVKSAIYSKMSNDMEFVGWDSQEEELFTFSKHASFDYIPNSFVQAVHNAYANHYALTLSPDHIWTAILQGFGIHVKLNSEKLRDQFVNFDGKQSLQVKRKFMPSGVEWIPVLQEFNELIQGFVGDDTYQIISPNFSTTGVLERTVANVAIMDSFQNYFDYSFQVVCGIPKITLLGTPQDWENLLLKFKQLEQFDLAFWVKELTPVLQQFVKASTGETDINFWQKIYSVEYGCGGPPEISGWIMKFFPYLIASGTTNGYELASFTSQGLRGTKIPSGISEVPVRFENSAELDLKFYAGFVGFTQTVKDDRQQLLEYLLNNSLKPILGWGVAFEQTNGTGLSSYAPGDAPALPNKSN